MRPDTPDHRATWIAGLDRRALLVALAVAPMMPVSAARRPPAIRTSPIRWQGANGRTLHGYMAVPARARGRQPAILVIGEAQALPPVPDPAARTLTEQLAAAGLLACTADNVTGLADLQTSLAWLRTNRYASGKVALVAFGSGSGVASRLVAIERATVGALLLLGAGTRIDTAVPTLVLGWHDGDKALPTAAAPFLKEHLA